jgi:hypothetical protein
MERKGILYGLLTTLVLIAYFFAMKGLGLSHNVELRAVNALFMFMGIFLSIRALKKEDEKSFGYLNGVLQGVITAGTVAISFGLFVFTYLSLDSAFLAEIKQVEPQGMYINAPGFAGLIFIEALASGLLFTYMSMQYLKKSYTLEA